LRLVPIVRAVGAVGGRRAEGPVPDLHRVAAAGNLDHRGTIEVPGEPLGVDGRRRDDDLEVGPARQQLLEVTQHEVDVQ
jgi:hypothetical protein